VTYDDALGKSLYPKEVAKPTNSAVEA